MNNKKNELEIRGSKVFTAVISSEYPVERGGYEEVIVHNADSIDLSRFPLPLLLEHDVSEQIGVVENPRFQGTQLLADIRFANDELSKTYEADVIDKVRNSLSIGYQSIKSYMEDGIRYITETLLMETSLVSIPADPSARFRKSDLQTNNFYTRSMKMEEKKLSRNESSKLREEISTIRHLGKKHNMSDEADNFIENGNSLEQFRSYVLTNISNDEPLPLPACDGLGNATYRNAPAFNRGHSQEYSVLRALEGIDDVSKRGYEWEVSQDLERSMPKSNPNAVILDTRTMTSGTAGANTIQNNVQKNIHDFMQQKSIALNLGATTFGGNVGNLEIPLGTSSSGATVLATDGTTQSQETTPTLSKLTLAPTRIADVVPLSYGFMQQSTPDVESYLRRLIAQTFAKVMDEQIMAGSGSSGNVQGILGTSGINAVSNGGTEVDFANFVSAISELGTDSVDLSNLKLIVNPANLDNLVTAVKYTSTDSPILDMKAEADGRIGTFNGYPVFVTNAVTVDNYIMGDFRELAIASWGGIEISKNDFYDDRRFISSLNAIMSFDSGLLEPKAMCKITKA
ncbi:phage major capsid protein [Gammaproteobacteria bacterium]|nr:phage major capsid protein [Gammaproteobacteria bacterium]